jgi:hypothetical protein
VIDRTGRGTTACRLHGAVLLASLDGARVYPLDGGRGSAIDVYLRAEAMRPFEGVLTGPGVQRVTTAEEAAVFPYAPDDGQSEGEPRSACSGAGNALRPGWLAGQRYQVGRADRGSAEDCASAVQGDGYEEVTAR